MQEQMQIVKIMSMSQFINIFCTFRVQMSTIPD